MFLASALHGGGWSVPLSTTSHEERPRRPFSTRLHGPPRRVVTFWEERNILFCTKLNLESSVFFLVA